MGVGLQDVDRLLDWSLSDGLPFELWADSNKTLSLYYGAISSEGDVNPAKIIRLLDSDGGLLLEYHSEDLDNPVNRVLEDLQILFG